MTKTSMGCHRAPKTSSLVYSSSSPGMTVVVIHHKRYEPSQTSFSLHAVYVTVRKFHDSLFISVSFIQCIAISIFSIFILQYCSSKAWGLVNAGAYYIKLLPEKNSLGVLLYTGFSSCSSPGCASSLHGTSILRSFQETECFNLRSIIISLSSMKMF